MGLQAAAPHLPHTVDLRVPPAVEQLVRLAHVAPVEGGAAQHLLPRRFQREWRARRLRRRGGECLAGAAALAVSSAALSASLSAALTSEVEAVVANRLKRAAELDVGAD